MRLLARINNLAFSGPLLTLRPVGSCPSCPGHSGRPIDKGTGPGRQTRRSTMPAIGYVTQSDNGTLKGQLKTLSIRAEIVIAPNGRKANDVQPDYRVYSGDVEIGAGWNRRSETSGNEYVSLSLAAPEFGPRRLYANLAR